MKPNDILMHLLAIQQLTKSKFARGGCEYALEGISAIIDPLVEEVRAAIKRDSKNFTWNHPEAE